MTAPEWAVEAFDAATDAATGASVKYKPSAREAAALELSRRCVPVEEYQRVVGALSDAIALIGHRMPMDTTALVAGEKLVAREVWNRGVQLLPFTAALKETGNAD